MHDVVLQKLPVRMVLDRAGLVGNDGPTHHGTFDLAYMGCLPDIVIMAPSDELELMHMTATAHGIDDLPSVLRWEDAPPLNPPLAHVKTKAAQTTQTTTTTTTTTQTIKPQPCHTHHHSNHHHHRCQPTATPGTLAARVTASRRSTIFLGTGSTPCPKRARRCQSAKAASSAGPPPTVRARSTRARGAHAKWRGVAEMARGGGNGAGGGRAYAPGVAQDGRLVC